MRAVLATYHRSIEDGHEGRGGPHRHMAVGPDTGRLPSLLARSLESPHILELDASMGDSSILLADAVCATRHLTTACIFTR
ncbi:hypothetical protein GCM10028792_21990 [Salinisphaera aquimarina]